MSVTIFWRPLSKTANHFAGGTSSSLEILNQVFGAQIGKEDVPALRAMALAARDTFYDEVADVVEKTGSIEIWGEF
jgi:hypothetical protein